MENNELLELLLAATVGQRARELRSARRPDGLTADERAHWDRENGAQLITDSLQELAAFRTALRAHFGAPAPKQESAPPHAPGG